MNNSNPRRVVCFEDNKDSRDRLLRAFSEYAPEFKFFIDPANDWDVTDKRAREIEEFNPTLIIIDLKDDKRRKKEAGLRIIRQLNEHFKDRFPLIAWSVLLSDKPTDQRYVNLVLDGGAHVVFKSKKRPTANQFLSRAGVIW